jgi:hypothetical protein
MATGDTKTRNSTSYIRLSFPASCHLFENMWVVAAPYLGYSLIMKPCLISNESIVQDVDSFRNEMSKPLAVTYSFVLSLASKLTYFVNSACTKLQSLRDPFKFPEVNRTCFKKRGYLIYFYGGYNKHCCLLSVPKIEVWPDRFCLQR